MKTHSLKKSTEGHHDHHLDEDEGLQDAEDEENSDDVPYEHEARLESEFGARSVSEFRQFTSQRPERPLAFMTPQVPKANGGLSLADRVGGAYQTFPLSPFLLSKLPPGQCHPPPFACRVMCIGVICTQVEDSWDVMVDSL
jgi:hypothetical protein